MFESLSDKFDGIFRKLRGHGRITEKHLDESLREVRLALLEADVAFGVVRQFTDAIRAQAIGREVLRSLTPEQQLVKIVYEELARLMGEQATGLDLAASPPVPVMLVGLQGSGKTTTIAKLARWLSAEKKRTPYLVPADVRRPAAIEQLRILGEQIGCAVHPSVAADGAVKICRDALVYAKNHGFDVVLFDTAGRLHVDEELMQELADVRAAVSPHQIVLVADAMTGQDAVNVAKGFHDRLGLTGTILTKMEGDARGGAALSIRAVTGTPILFLGIGEKLDALEPFYPDRLAQRILGMGDVLSLIEKAEKAFDLEQAAALEKKLKKNEFTLEDFREQLRTVKKMGSVTDILGMIPGLGKMVKQVDSAKAEKDLGRVEAIINSMTRQEREKPGLLNASRRRRIALGSGMMKKLTRGGLPAGLPF
jgi:signal recognition particle subunit SRP54